MGEGVMLLNGVTAPGNSSANQVKAYLLTGTNIVYVRNSSGADFPLTPEVLNNFIATVAPTANEDSDDGYAVGSVWINVTGDDIYICVDSTVASAVWLEIAAVGAGDLDARYFAVAGDIVEGDMTFADGINIVTDTTTGTEIGTAAGQKVGFHGATPIIQAVEITDELTDVTHTAPGTPDYALQDLVDSGAGSAFGFATKDEGNTLLSVVVRNALRIKELEDLLVAKGLLADAD